jgi:hypothetical protein
MGKLALGLAAIGGIIAVVWIVHGGPAHPVAAQTPEPPHLDDARAVVTVRGAGRAAITCDGDRRTATGFWAANPVRACDALASTRGALLEGPGCASPPTLHAVGAFGSRRFDRRGCRNTEDWLTVAALAVPVLDPAQKLDDAR